MKTQEFSRASSEHPDRCEDAVMVFAGGSNGESKAPVFAVIDGMGGQQHETAEGKLMTGRDASQMVRDTLIEDLQRLPTDIDGSSGGEAEQKVIAALNRAHERIFLWVDSFDPHEPWTPPREFDRYTVPGYQGKRIILPPGGEAGAGVPHQRSEQ